MKKHLSVIFATCAIFTFFVTTQNTAAQEQSPPVKKLQPRVKRAAETQKTEEQIAEKRKQIEEKIELRATRGRKRQRPGDKRRIDRKRLQRIDKGIEGRQDEHKAFIGELKAIKQLALKENAQKTANRLDKLVEKQNARFEESLKLVQQSRGRLREQFKEKHLTSEGEEQQEAQPVKPGKSEKPGKKAKKWWQFWK